MTVYHGSNIEVREPKILKPNRELDFGNGFYTTTNLDQAIAFAKAGREQPRHRSSNGFYV